MNILDLKRKARGHHALWTDRGTDSTGTGSGNTGGSLSGGMGDSGGSYSGGYEGGSSGGWDYWSTPVVAPAPVAPVDYGIAPSKPSLGLTADAGGLAGTGLGFTAKDLGLDAIRSDYFSKSGYSLGSDVSYSDLSALNALGMGGMSLTDGQNIGQALAAKNVNTALEKYLEPLMLSMLPPPMSAAFSAMKSIGTKGNYGEVIGGLLGNATGLPIGGTLGGMLGKGLQTGAMPSSTEIGGKLLGAIGSQFGGRALGQLGYNAFGANGGQFGGMLGSRVGGYLGGTIGGYLGDAVGYAGTPGTPGTPGTTSAPSTFNDSFNPSKSSYDRGWDGFFGAPMGGTSDTPKPTNGYSTNSIVNVGGNSADGTLDYVGGKAAASGLGSQLRFYLDSVGSGQGSPQSPAAKQSLKTTKGSNAPANLSTSSFVGGKYNPDQLGAFNGFSQNVSPSQTASSGWFS